MGEPRNPGLHEQVTASIGAAEGSERVHPTLTRIGSYKLIRLLGEGGFGAVYLAEQASPRRLVAIKVLKPTAASRQAMARFEHEAQTLARLQHPGIAQVLEAGFYDVGSGEVAEKSETAKQRDSETGQRRAPFFAMEYIQGEALAAYVKRAGLKTRDTVGLIIKVCEAVQHAHNHGVIHRDLKPANILVDKLGQPKILDFGVARVSDEDVARVTARTDVGQMIGTLAYMSPEQVAADPAKVDTRSDVYALGVILFEVLTGRLPYEVDRKLLHEATRTICESEPARLGTISRAFRGDLETIEGRALEKEKGRRYQSAAALAEDLRRFLHDEPIVARPPSAVYQWKKFAKRNKALVGGIAGVMVALAAGALVASVQAVRATVARDRARLEAEKAIAATGFLEETLAAADPDKKGKDVRLSDVLDDAAVEVETGLEGRPEVAAAVRRALARAYKGLGLYDKALAQMKQVIELQKQAGHKPDDPDSLEARRLSALILQEKSEFAAAESELKAVREAKLRLAGGKEDEASLLALEDLSRLYASFGKLPDAEEAARRALAGLQTLQGEESDESLRAMLHLADVLGAKLAANEIENGEECETLFKRVLSVRERTLKPGDKVLQSTREALGAHYRALGRYAESAEVHRTTAAAYEVKYGPEHPRTLSKKSDLGKSLQQAGKVDEAEAVLAPTLEALKRVVGPDEFDTLTCAAFLGDTYMAAGKLDKAESMRRYTAEARVRLLGPDHSQTLIGWTNLGLILIDEGKLDEARAIFEDLLARRERLLGPGHNEVGLTIGLLGMIEMKRDNWGAAEGLYRRSLAIREKVLPEGSGIRGITMSSLGHALAMQGKFAEAEPLEKKGAEWVLADPRAPGRNKKDAVDRIVTMYTKMSQAERAAEWRGKLPK